MFRPLVHFELMLPILEIAVFSCGNFRTSAIRPTIIRIAASFARPIKQDDAGGRRYSTETYRSSAAEDLFGYRGRLGQP